MADRIEVIKHKSQRILAYDFDGDYTSRLPKIPDVGHTFDASELKQQKSFGTFEVKFANALKQLKDKSFVKVGRVVVVILDVICQPEEASSSVILYQTGEALNDRKKIQIDVVIGLKKTFELYGVAPAATKKYLKFQASDRVDWLLEFESKEHRNDILAFLKTNRIHFNIQRDERELKNLVILPSKEGEVIAKLKRRISKLEDVLQAIKKKASIETDD